MQKFYCVFFLVWASAVFADPPPPPPPPGAGTAAATSASASAQVTLSTSPAAQKQVKNLFDHADYDHLANSENGSQTLEVNP